MKDHKKLLNDFLFKLSEDVQLWSTLKNAEKEAWAEIAANILIENVIGPKPLIPFWKLLTLRIKRAEDAAIKTTRLLSEQAWQLKHFGLYLLWVRVRKKIDSGQHSYSLHW